MFCIGDTSSNLWIFFPLSCWLNHFRSATKYFFLNVVLNLAFGVLLGDPFPSIQETMGALVILLSLSVFSEKRGRFVV